MNFKTPILGLGMLVTLSTSSAHAFIWVHDEANILQAAKQVEAMVKGETGRALILARGHF